MFGLTARMSTRTENKLARTSGDRTLCRRGITHNKGREVPASCGQSHHIVHGQGWAVTVVNLCSLRQLRLTMEKRLQVVPLCKLGASNVGQ